MNRTGRYDTSGLVEGQFEPGSQRRVLRNLIGIKRKREMDAIESAELLRTTEQLIQLYDSDHRFSAEDLRTIHKTWLGRIYEWAGHYRMVNLAKGGFLFSAAHLIPMLMGQFEKECLAVYTPCRFSERGEVAHALAVVHVELLLIHPFREGNGRLARLLASLMALQAGSPLLDFGMLKGKWKREYITAIQCGLDRNYDPMKKIFGEVIDRSLRLQKRRVARSGSSERS
jgi:cell filamentation protein